MSGQSSQPKSAQSQAKAAAEPSSELDNLRTLVELQQEQMAAMQAQMDAMAVGQSAAKTPETVPQSVLLEAQIRRHQAKFDAKLAEREATVNRARAALQDGPQQWDVWIDDPKGGIACPKMLVGAGSKYEAEGKYKEFNGVTGHSGNLHAELRESVAAAG